jgi:hypothetical protein
MSLPRLKAKRYCDRAQECLEIAAKAHRRRGGRRNSAAACRVSNGKLSAAPTRLRPERLAS